MANYKIIGADQKEYGPVPADQIRRWVAEGRLNSQSQAQEEGGTVFQALATFAEFSDIFSAPPPFAAGPPAPERGLPSDLFSRDYDLDIGQCLSNGWNLMSKNFGLLVGGCALFLLVQIALSVLGQIPLLGLIFTAATFIITGPLTGGVYLFCLKVLRAQRAEVGDVFAGFRTSFIQLFLGYIVTCLLSGLAALPGFLIMFVPIFMMISQHAANPVQVIIAAAGFLIAIIPMIYLAIGWMFTLPLIIDRQMEFWPAMQASRQRVGQHWWIVFGLLVVCGLVNSAGLLVCCVGVFISMPVVFAAMMYAYQTLFCETPAPTP